MSKLWAIIIILILLLLFYRFYYKYSHWNNIKIAPCFNCEKYSVHQEHINQKEAANLLKEMTKRNSILIEHLKNKYQYSKFQPAIDNYKSGKIDIIPEMEIYNNNSSFNNVGANEYILNRIDQLVKRYDPQKIYEISPLNSSGVTSYTQDKKTLIFCLRKKDKNKKGEHDLHDINTVMFVDIHELTHMMNNTWGHHTDFWILFRFMLENAVECNIYKPEDYQKKPINYCGLILSYNPILDPILQN